MSRYLALPIEGLADATTDFEAAKLQAQELIDKHGKHIGRVVVIEFSERGQFEYARPIWSEASQEQSPSRRGSPFMGEPQDKRTPSSSN